MPEGDGPSGAEGTSQRPILLPMLTWGPASSAPTSMADLPSPDQRSSAPTPQPRAETPQLGDASVPSGTTSPDPANSEAVQSTRGQELRVVLFHPPPNGHIVAVDDDNRLFHQQFSDLPPDVSQELVSSLGRCPLCRQPVDARFAFVAATYFKILQELKKTQYSANNTPEYGFSQSPFATTPGSDRSGHGEEELPDACLRNLPRNMLNQGYYSRFFEEVRRLGSGSFGTVYLSRHRLDEILLGEYAIKKVPVGDNKQWLRRMLREVHAFERLHHANIVAYKHSWIELSRANEMCPYVPFLFILMQYCNGGSLEELIWPAKEESAKRRRKRNRAPCHMDEALVCAMFLDITQGLQHLHQQGIIHRDLKPTNILLECTTSPAGGPVLHALLSDFGTAEVIGAARETHDRGGYTGTIAFTAPELLVPDEEGLMREDYDERSDMWSLGICLYCMVFGKLPWGDLSEADDPHVLKAAVTSMCGTLPDLVATEAENMAQRRDRNLEEIIVSLTTLDPEQRPSAGAVLRHKFVRAVARWLEETQGARRDYRGGDAGAPIQLAVATSPRFCPRMGAALMPPPLELPPP
mmetsp:Transcript_19178/g.42546  ORF Transcript_19178/g.42546 Transcript_19178/m.42546 type:complete len:580 (+) Transcript_19178:31-1770(+)